MSRFIRYSFACMLPMLFLAVSAAAQDDTKGTGRTKKEWLKILEEDKKVRLRKAAVLALGIYGAEQSDVLDALKKTLLNEKEDLLVRAQVMSVLNTLSDKALQNEVSTLADVMKFDKAGEIRAAAIVLLGRLGKNARPALTALTEMLKDPDANVRLAAAETIGKIGPDARAAQPELVALLKDADKGIRAAAVEALGRFGPEAAAAIPDLILILEKDANADLRKAVVRAVARFGPDGKPALPALLKALKDDKAEEVREEIALSLGRMEAELRPNVTALKDALRQDRNKTVRLYLIRTISSTEGPDLKNHVKDFAELLQTDKDGDVRVALVQELGSLGPDAREALPVLENALGDVQVAVRDATREAIKKIKGDSPGKK